MERNRPNGGHMPNTICPQPDRRAGRQPIDLWLRGQLKQRYDAALDEALPRELVDLLDRAEACRAR